MPDARRRNTDEVADVDVWNTADERIQSQQMIRAEADRNFTFRQGFDVADGRFIKLADETMRDIDIALTGKWAVGRDTRGYISDYKRPAADIYRVNTTTGERTLIYKGLLTGSGHARPVAERQAVPVLEGQRIQRARSGRRRRQDSRRADAAELRRHGVRPAGSAAVVRRRRLHAATAARSSRSIATTCGCVPLDGSAREEPDERLRHEERSPLPHRARSAPLDPLADFGPGGAAAERQIVDLSKPITLSAYGEYTKKAGFFELANGQLREIVFEDASFSTPARAAKADTYLFTRQTFVEFPDLRVSGPDFKASKKITDANPQQSEYLVGQAHPVRLQEQGRRAAAGHSRDSRRLQGRARSGR